jgi:outer membrane protein TolC
LLKQRHETFRELVEMLVAQYRAGVVDFGRVAAAQRDMLRAAAELEEDAQKRLDALRGVVEIATRVQQGTEDRHKAGIVGQADVLQAKAVLLEARIELLREELRSRRGK